MAQKTIKVIEYSCERCNYKWIARHNGVDKDTPNSCPRCKTYMWNQPRYADMLDFHLRQWRAGRKNWIPLEYRKYLWEYIQEWKGDVEYEDYVKRYKAQFPDPK